MRCFARRRISFEAFQVKDDEHQEVYWPDWAQAARIKGDDEIGAIIPRPILPGYCIETLSGRVVVEPGDWILRSEVGEILGCKAADFDRLYETEA